MRARAIVVATLVTLATHAPDAHAESTGDDQVVVVNAAARLGTIGQIARIRRVLDSRKLLVRLPETLEATLDGRNVLIADIDAIKEAYASSDYDVALRIIEEDEQRILREAVSRDPMPALAELSQWRGIIAAAGGEKEEAMRWFRAAYRFNPAWSIDKKLASPRVRSIVRRARREVSATGTLRISTDPEDAIVSIDGGAPRAASDKITLPVGTHLVMISAPRRKPYAELVDIEERAPYQLEINLDPETRLDRAARLVDATTAAPAGKPRLRKARALGKLTGVTRMLFVEDGGDHHVTVRLYDLETRKVSKPLDLEGTATSAAIARKIIAALDPDNLVDVDTIVVSQRANARRASTPWYARWYVWAAVGAVAVGGYVSYEHVTREPTAVRGF